MWRFLCLASPHTPSKVKSGWWQRWAPSAICIKPVRITRQCPTASTKARDQQRPRSSLATSLSCLPHSPSRPCYHDAGASRWKDVLHWGRTLHKRRKLAKTLWLWQKSASYCEKARYVWVSEHVQGPKMDKKMKINVFACFNKLWLH